MNQSPVDMASKGLARQLIRMSDSWLLSHEVPRSVGVVLRFLIIFGDHAIFMYNIVHQHPFQIETKRRQNSFQVLDKYEPRSSCEVQKNRHIMRWHAKMERRHYFRSSRAVPEFKRKITAHFRVLVCLCLKTSLRAKLWKWVWFARKWTCRWNTFS